MSLLKEKILLKFAFPIADKIMGTCAMKWFERISTMNTWSSEEITEWQLNKLHELIHHVYDHTKYYREIFDNLGLKPDDIRDFDDLKQLKR